MNRIYAAMFVAAVAASILLEPAIALANWGGGGNR